MEFFLFAFQFGKKKKKVICETIFKNHTNLDFSRWKDVKHMSACSPSHTPGEATKHGADHVFWLDTVRVSDAGWSGPGGSQAAVCQAVVTSSTGTTKGSVPSPFLFSDNSSIVGCITDDKEEGYREQGRSWWWTSGVSDCGAAVHFSRWWAKLVLQKTVRKMSLETFFHCLENDFLLIYYYSFNQQFSFT